MNNLRSRSVRGWLLSGLMVLGLGCTALAEPPAPSEATGEAEGDPPIEETAADAPLTLAVLDFEAKVPGNEDLGSQLADVLTALLAAENGLRLVERSELAEVMEEQELSLTGMVDTDDAVEVGRLIGAQILVTGRAFPLGKKTYITTKIIGVETSLVDGLLVKGEAGGDIEPLLLRLAEKLGEQLRDGGPKLLGREDDGGDPVGELVAALAKLPDKPVVGVYVPEQHHARAPDREQAIDPAVETEIMKLLKQAGFTVIDVRDSDALSAWAREPGRTNWPERITKVDAMVVGEAISEYSTRIGTLVGCTGRVEVKLVDRESGEVRFIERQTQRGVDLSENIAAKKALEKAGRSLGVKLLAHYHEALTKEANDEE